MGVVDILFNPNGRIRASEFWRGVIILIGLGVITQVAALYGPPALAIASLLVQLVMIYMYVCVFGKRLHDSGKPRGYPYCSLSVFSSYPLLANPSSFPLLRGIRSFRPK